MGEYSTKRVVSSLPLPKREWFASLVPRELSIGGPVGGSCILTHALHFVLFVRLNVAFTSVPMRRILFCPLVGEDVGSNAVEEPAIVGDDHSAPGEF